MKSGFKYSILILLLESVASLPTYNGELLTGEYIPPPQPQQYSYIWNGNGPLQSESSPWNARVHPRSFSNNVNVQPQYDIQPPTHHPAYGPISFGNYHQTGVPTEQHANLPTNQRQNIVFHPKYGPISASQQYHQTDPANISRDTAIQQQLANQQAELIPQHKAFYPTYEPTSAAQQYQQTVPFDREKETFQERFYSAPHRKLATVTDKTAREMAIEQQLANQQAEHSISPIIGNYAMRHPTAIHKLPTFSQPHFVRNHPQISALNEVPTSYSNFMQHQPFEESIERGHLNNVVKTLPLVSAAPRPNRKKDMNNDMEHSASNNIPNRLNSNAVHTEQLKNIEEHKISNNIKNRITNAGKETDKHATNANVVKNLYDHLNRQFEQNSAWPSYHNINQMISNDPEIINALLPSNKTGEKKYIVIHADGTVEHVEQLETVARKFPDYVLVQPNQLTNTVINEPVVSPEVKLPETQLHPIKNENQQIPDLTMQDAEDTHLQVSSRKTEEQYPQYEVPLTLSTTTAMVDNKQAIVANETEFTNAQNTNNLQIDSTDGQTNAAANSHSITNISNEEKLVNQDSSNISADQDIELSTKTVAVSDSQSGSDIIAVPVLDQYNKNSLMKTIFSQNDDEEAKFSKSDYNDTKTNSQTISNSASNIEHEENTSNESSSYTIIKKRLNDKLESLSDEIIKFLFMKSMVSQSKQGGSDDEKSNQPLALLDTSDPDFVKKILGNDTSSLVYFFQAPTKPVDKENSFSVDNSQNA